jgi:hypothetical protein
MYLRPGFIVVIVGCVLTGLSTVTMMLRYAHSRSIISVKTNFVLSYYCRYFLVGTLTATDHLMFTALVCVHLKMSKSAC